MRSGVNSGCRVPRTETLQRSNATGLRIVALYFDGHLIGTEKVQMIKP